jgi:hypothetical protein
VLGEEARRLLHQAVVMARSEGRYVVPTGDVAALDAVLDAVVPVVASLLSFAREEGERAERERIGEELVRRRDSLRATGTPEALRFARHLDVAVRVAAGPIPPGEVAAALAAAPDGPS